MRTLDAIGILHGTDKSSKGHSYLQYYEIFFDQFRFKEINILEIGVDKGDSVRMWREYFSHGEIHGIDIRGDYEYLNQEGIITHIVDQSNKGALEVFGTSFDQYFDIIIDDGSHQSRDQILTFDTLFPNLKSGGFYVCEDLLCDYDSRWNEGASSIEWFSALAGNVHMNGEIPNSNICANKKEAVKKYGGSYLDLNIEYVFTSCGLCIIKKI
jgi:Methyltransferase domain